MPELLAHERQPHELVVLVAVADDQVLGAFGKAKHRLQFGLRTAFEAHTVRLAELHDFLNDVALLVDLDRIHRGIPAGVFEFLDRRGEPLGERFDA